MRATTRWLGLAILTMLTSCVSRGYPTHGGGKRFFQEQALVTGAIDEALDQIEFQKVPAIAAAKKDNKSTISVHVFSVAHSGGGVSGATGGPFASVFGGLFGGVPVLGGGRHVTPHTSTVQALANGLPVTTANTGYLSYAFGSADDIRYVMGRLISKLGEQGLTVQTADGAAPGEPVLCILIRQLGIDQSDFNALVYSEKLLRARSSIEAFVVHQEKDENKQDRIRVTPLGDGTGTMRFREDFFLGIGPLSGGYVEVDDTEDGQ